MGNSLKHDTEKAAGDKMATQIITVGPNTLLDLKTNTLYVKASVVEGKAKS